MIIQEKSKLRMIGVLPSFVLYSEYNKRCHTPEDHPLQCRRLIFLLPKAASQDGSSIQVLLPFTA